MNQQEQIAQGSLRSSHRNTHAVVFKKTVKKDQEQVISFLTSMCKDLVISQRISSNNTIGSSDRQNSIASNLSSYAEVPLKKATFFVHTTSSKVEPGFLVFIPNTNPVFVKYNLSKREREQNKGQPICYTLRMRVSSEIYQGSVFVASLDGISHTMRLEDVYVWKKEDIFQTKSFIERRKYMKEFVEHHWIPDVRLLGGIITNIMNPLPLSSLSNLKNAEDFTKVFLIPNTSGKRRFTFNLNESVAHIQNGYYGRKEQDNKQVNQKKSDNLNEQKTSPIVSEYKEVAKAVRIPLLPDIYELYDLSGNSLNKATVQSLELSKLLKEKKNEIVVKIRYNSDFNRYEIIALASP